MMHIGPPLASMDLYLRREKGTISGVIHDMRAGKWACISGLDQLLLYLADVIDEEQGRRDTSEGKSRGPELPEMSESFARIPAKNVKSWSFMSPAVSIGLFRAISVLWKKGYGKS